MCHSPSASGALVYVCVSRCGSSALCPRVPDWLLPAAGFSALRSTGLLTPALYLGSFYFINCLKPPSSSCVDRHHVFSRTKCDGFSNIFLLSLPFLSDELLLTGFPCIPPISSNVFNVSPPLTVAYLTSRRGAAETTSTRLKRFPARVSVP